MKIEIVKEALIKTLKEIDRMEDCKCGVGLCHIIGGELGYAKTIVKLILKLNKIPIKPGKYSYLDGDNSRNVRRSILWYLDRKQDVKNLLYYLENEHKSDNVYLKDF